MNATQELLRVEQQLSALDQVRTSLSKYEYSKSYTFYRNSLMDRRRHIEYMVNHNSEVSIQPRFEGFNDFKFLG